MNAEEQAMYEAAIAQENGTTPKTPRRAPRKTSGNKATDGAKADALVKGQGAAGDLALTNAAAVHDAARLGAKQGMQWAQAHATGFGAAMGKYAEVQQRGFDALSQASEALMQEQFDIAIADVTDELNDFFSGAEIQLLGTGLAGYLPTID